MEKNGRTQSESLYQIRKAVIGLIIAALLIGFDHYTKWLAVTHLKNQAPFVIWDGVFELRYLENRGAAFGLLQGKISLFIILTLAALVLLCYFYLKKVPKEPRYRFLDLICILFFSGAIGNLIDRVINGYVVDFFYFSFIDFPIFNVADIYDVAAAASMIVLGLFYYKDEDYEKVFPSWNK